MFAETLRREKLRDDDHDVVDGAGDFNIATETTQGSRRPKGTISE